MERLNLFIPQANKAWLSVYFLVFCRMMLLNPVKLCLYPTPYAHQHTSTQHTAHSPEAPRHSNKITVDMHMVSLQKSISPFKTQCSVHKGKFIHDFAISNTAFTINKLFVGKTRLNQTTSALK